MTGVEFMTQGTPIRFSIVIPTCNRPEMLKRAIESANQQTYRRFEIVVVDDASEVSATFDSGITSPIKLIRSCTRLGPGGARNLGVAHASGDWISFLDDDDEYDKDFLSVTTAHINQFPTCTFTWSNVALMDYSKRGKFLLRTDTNLSTSYPSEGELLSATASIGAGFGLCIRTDIFQNLKGFDQTYAAIEDTEFLFRLLQSGNRPAIIAQPLVRVHNHMGARLTSRELIEQRMQECQRLSAHYKEFIAQHPALKQYLQFTINALKKNAEAGFIRHCLADLKKQILSIAPNASSYFGKKR